MGGGREAGGKSRGTAVAAAARRRAASAPLQLFYSVVPCPLGFLLVAASARGLRAVRLDDRREALLNGLKADFPGAALAEDAARMAVYADPLLHYLRGGKANLAGLALDLEATPFQWKVWNVLLALRPGETITYAELARRVGDVKAVRAVARANATNPVAVVIPCHRVVGSDGSLTGYRWGLERKRQLLELEGARPPQEKLF